MISSRAPEKLSTRFKVEDIVRKLPAAVRAEFLKLSPQEQQFLLSMNAEEGKVYAQLAPSAGAKFAKLPKSERRAEAKLDQVARQVERVQARPLAVSAAKLAGTSLTAPAPGAPAPKPVPVYAPKAVSPVAMSLASVKAGAVLCAAVAKKPAGPVLAARNPVGRSRCARAPIAVPSKMYLLFSGGVLRP